MHAILSYRGNRPTNTHTNKQTGPITIHCAAVKQSQNFLFRPFAQKFPWSDCHQIWHAGSIRGPDQLCQFFGNRFKGFDSVGGQSSILSRSMEKIIVPVVKVVLWSRGLTWQSQVGANPIPIPTPTNLALFGHKYTLYRFNQWAHTITGGLKLEQGAEPTLAPSL